MSLVGLAPTGTVLENMNLACVVSNEWWLLQDAYQRNRSA